MLTTAIPDYGLYYIVRRTQYDRRLAITAVPVCTRNVLRNCYGLLKVVPKI